MAQVPIIMPQLGESIAEAAVIRFLIEPGDLVQADQEVIEVETSKATLTVTAPCVGRLSSFIAVLDQSYPVGSVLGYVEGEGGDSGGSKGERVEGDSAPGLPAEPKAPVVPTERRVEPTVRGLPVPAHASGASYLSPRLRARMEELGLHAADLAGLAGSGANGRVTVDDFESFIASIEALEQTDASSMRVAVADAMRRSWTRPLATVGLTVPLDPVLRHRRKLDPKPGPALYAVRALALALAGNSAVAGRLIGRRIVHPAAIDIGVAVEADDGVLVPVIRGADQRALHNLTAEYNRLVALARQRRLPPEATGRSIATVTNYGTFGLTWATPIPLPEQTLVLGLGAGRHAPLWDAQKGVFVPILEANLTLSFDHRVLDGGAAGRLLAKVAGLMGDPEAL